MPFIQINSGGTWKTIWGTHSSTSYDKEKINVSGTWKVPQQIKINVSNAWKTISK